MGGQVYSEYTGVRRVPSPASDEQVVAAREYGQRGEEQTSAFGVVHQFFVQPGLSGTKNPGVVGLRIKNGGTIRRGNHIRSRCYTAWSSSECRHCPNLVRPGRPLVIDFLSIGRKCIHSLLA